MKLYPQYLLWVKKKNDDASCCFFPWCGFLFDTSSCEVRVDYSRSSGTQAIDSLTVDRTGNEGINLQVRMKAWIRPRCRSLLYESTINGADVLMINFYQSMLLCAVKTYHYVTNGMHGGIRSNVKFISRSIEEVILYAYKLIVPALRSGKEWISQKKKGKQKKNSTQQKHYDFDSCSLFNEEVALQLGHHAFIHVLQSKREGKELIIFLEQRHRDIVKKKRCFYIRKLIRKALNEMKLINFHW